MIYNGTKYYMVVAKHPDKDIISLWSGEHDKLVFNVRYVDVRVGVNKELNKPQHGEYVSGRITNIGERMSTFFITDKCGEEGFI